MPRTITLSDATCDELARALGVTPSQPPAEQPPTAPTGVRVVPVKWGYRPPVGQQHETLHPGETLAFAFTVPLGYTSHGLLRDFSISPTDQDAYFDRDLCLSDAPGDFSTKLGLTALKRGQEPNVYFSVAGYPVDKYQRTDTSNANLQPGRTYYANVRQVDPTLQCNINFGLAV